MTLRHRGFILNAVPAIGHGVLARGDADCIPPLASVQAPSIGIEPDGTNHHELVQARTNLAPTRPPNHTASRLSVLDIISQITSTSAHGLIVISVCDLSLRPSESNTDHNSKTLPLKTCTEVALKKPRVY
ncbi:uncharacterized protein HD556DRAFT_1444027 [Suillus plorans]|uniref:Uncharacterized protein n=1 Tax=Suillus plorans TaxID=116603 RepID=A0A9P7DHJ1_9AGAM|nr:uncharacterized protein HD556DRAFT_1444027 [Suillus plorans]KAG1792948.1 hypothetical protein HD556DRAFT_1444027 [Suillus plorans]